MKENTTYNGWVKWSPTLDEWANFSVDKKYTGNEELRLNEYLLIYNEGKLSNIYRQGQDKLIQVGSSSIKIKDKKTISPKNDEQKCAFDLIQNPDITVKLLTGTWGSGKTFILVNGALAALNSKKYERIVWIRNNVDVKDTKDLGALPGEINDKLKPFLGPFIDHCGEKEVTSMIEKGTLTVEPLQSLRGRSFENTLIMCSEAENLTKEHIQLILARAGEGSSVLLDADIRQRDKSVFEKSRGIETLIERLAGNELFGYVHLIKTERSKTASLADLLDD